ncbi:type VI secretion system-associated protein TagF [Psychromonas antarctica]|uniref:type VI secretion system-associated protein TagF n=1 Tax=Psychromonas antarctica TaxID=67573 RepID=UPI001EE8EB57|nr:type VI secretion system-associated protein TagF [Psychromonas antarctica]MCG6201229.1 type VI secretion system-associated protein TagF [Psychromonas antarctica]
MSEPVVNRSIGYCGKIPTKGDFIQSNFDIEFLQIWNEWLQAVIAVSKEQLEDNWLDCYLTSPIWHFSLSAGVCGDSAAIGTLMPSVDKVNRYFPFTIVAKHTLTAVQAWHENEWDVILETKILEALKDEFDLEIWFDKLADEVKLIDSDKISISNIESMHKIKKAWVVQGQFSPTILQLIHQQYYHQFKNYSLWWTTGSDLINPCFIVTDGLPQVSQFVSMLDGNWELRDWNISEIV